MKAALGQYLRLVLGLALYALGVVLTLRADIGYAPWEVFHAGLGKALGISLGMASILVSLVVCGLDLLFKEKLGMGTLFNIFLIGSLIDLFSLLVPALSGAGVPLRVLLMVLGLFVLAFGLYFYIGAGLGAGPRDSLMVALQRKTGFPVGLCRGLIEGLVLLSGWLLGGPVGPGTLIGAAGVGLCIQIVFRLMRFDARSVRHEDFGKSLSRLKTLLRSVPGV